MVKHKKIVGKLWPTGQWESRGQQPTYCLNVFDHFEGLALKGLLAIYLSNSSDLLTSQHSKTGSSNMLTQSLSSHLKQSIHFSVTSAREPLFSDYSYLFENSPEECLPFWRIKLLSCTVKSE